MWGIITNLEYLLFFWIYLLNKSQTFFTHRNTIFFFFSWKLSALRQDNNFFFTNLKKGKISNLFFGEQLLGIEVATQSSREDELKQDAVRKVFHNWATKRHSDLNWCVPWKIFVYNLWYIYYDTFINSYQWYHHWVKIILNLDKYTIGRLYIHKFIR